MYKIYADNTLIYDSTFEDYKIYKASISLETNKSGSFTFALYPDHFYYDSFVKLKTIVTVYKSDKIIFRGRVLNDVTDYQNNKTFTCEGELGFLQDSIARPYTFTGTPREFFVLMIQNHNAQVDDFKKFKIGKVTVTDPNDYIIRENTNYESTFDNVTSRLIENENLGGYFYITHGDDGQDETPTINYLADFEHVATQYIEFGENLKDFTKTIKAEDIATVIIPLGAQLEDENTEDDVEPPRLTIEGINNGVDYVYSQEGVALYGRITKVVQWDDITIAENLKSKAEEYLQSVINQNVTIELTAIDLHLLDRDIESFNVGDYIRVVSSPHNFDSVLLCNKQTIDLLKPENDTVTLGYTYSMFSETASKIASSLSAINNIKNNVGNIRNKVSNLNQNVSNALEQTTNNSEDIITIYSQLNRIGWVTGEFTCPTLSAGANTTVAVEKAFGFTPSTILFTENLIDTSLTNVNNYAIKALSDAGFTVQCFNAGAASANARTVRYIAFT